MEGLIYEDNGLTGYSASNELVMRNTKIRLLASTNNFNKCDHINDVKYIYWPFFKICVCVYI